MADYQTVVKMHDLRDSECGMIVCARCGGPTISDPAALRGDFHVRACSELTKTSLIKGQKQKKKNLQSVRSQKNGQTYSKEQPA